MVYILCEEKYTRWEELGHVLGWEFLKSESMGYPLDCSSFSVRLLWQIFRVCHGTLVFAQKSVRAEDSQKKKTYSEPVEFRIPDMFQGIETDGM